MNLGLGQVALAQGNYDQAVNYMESAAKVKRTAIHLFWIGSAYSAKGDKDKAFASIQESFKLGFRDFSAIDNSPVSRLSARRPALSTARPAVPQTVRSRGCPSLRC